MGLGFEGGISELPEFLHETLSHHNITHAVHGYGVLWCGISEQPVVVHETLSHHNIIQAVHGFGVWGVGSQSSL